MSLEQELVRLCARTRIDSNTVEKIHRLVQESLDWQQALQVADHHGVLPLLYWNLHRTCPSDVPPTVLAELRDRYLRNAQRNLMLAQELLSVIERLRRNQIPAIPFKGPLLAVMAYGDLALRQIADLDIIVPKPDVRRVKEMVLAHGYYPIYQMDHTQEAMFLASNCALTLRRDNPRVDLDIHWDLTPKYFYCPFDLKQMQRRLVSLELGGVSVPTLRPEDLLLVLCVHGARHVWERLDWLVSVAELVRARTDLDWDWMLAQAGKSKSERMLLLGLALADQMLDAKVPPAIQDHIRADPTIARLSTEISTRLWRTDTRRVGLFEDTFVDGLHPLMFKRRTDRLRYYGALIFSPTAGDAASLRLPALFFFAYYFFRPLRLIARFGPRWLKARQASKTIAPDGKLIDKQDSGC